MPISLDRLNQIAPSKNAPTTGGGGITIDRINQIISGSVPQPTPTPTLQVQPQRGGFQQKIVSAIPAVAKIGVSVGSFLGQIKSPKDIIPTIISTYKKSQDAKVDRMVTSYSEKIEEEKAKPKPNQKKIVSYEKSINELGSAKGAPQIIKKSIISKEQNKRYFNRFLGDLSTTITGITDFIYKTSERDAELMKTGSQMAGQPKWLANFYEGEAVKGEVISGKALKVSEGVKLWAKEVSPTNPTFMEDLAGGAGSMSGFLLISVATGSPAEAMSVLEAMQESGGVYYDNRKAGKSIAESSELADKDFFANLVINYITNRYGLFSNRAKGLKKTLLSFHGEGLQEAYQQIASNITTGRPLMEGVWQSFFIGGALGGGASVILPNGSIMEMTGEGEKITTGEIKAEEPKVVPTPPVVIPPVPPMKVAPTKLLEPLAQEGKSGLNALTQEARKYKSAEEFVNKNLKTLGVEIRPLKGDLVGKYGVQYPNSGFIQDADVFSTKADAIKSISEKVSIKGQSVVDFYNQSKVGVTPQGLDAQKITSKVVEATDNNGVPVKYLQVNATPNKSSLDTLIPFAKSKGLTPAETDDFFLLVNKGEIYQNIQEIGGNKGVNINKVKSAYTDFINQSKVGVTPQTLESLVKSPDLTIKEKPSILYRGLGGDNVQAQQLLTGTHYTDRLNTAAEFAGTGYTRGEGGLLTSNKVVGKYKISPNTKIADLDRVKAFLSENQQLADKATITKLLKEQGYDGAVGTLPGKGKEWIITNPRMIKEIPVGVGVTGIEKGGRNLMEIENADLTLPELKSKLNIAIEGKEEPYLINQIKKDIASRVGVTEKPKTISKPTLKVVEKLVIKPKVVSVPRTQLPVGEGKKVVSRLEARMKKTLDNVSQEQIDKLGLTTYNKMTDDQQIKSASEYITTSPDDALEVLKGNLEPPKGLLRNSVYVAMVNNSVGKPDLITKLASLTSTRFGQEIEILKNLDPDSSVKWVSDVIKIREDAIEKKYKKSVSEKVDEEVKKIDNEINKQVKKITKGDWISFVNELEC